MNKFVYYDQHIHSSYSRDSKEDLESYYQIALEKGIKYVVTCEHFDPFTTVDGTTWEADYDDLLLKQKQLKIKYPFITPLLGIELGYRKDHLEFMKEKVSKYDFDIIQLSVHDNGQYDYYFPKYYNQDDPLQNVNEYFDVMIEAINTWDNYDVLSHIDYCFKIAKMVKDDIKISSLEEKIKIIFNKIIKDNKAFEINTKVQESINDDEHVKYLLNLYKSLGGTRVTLSSDAHVINRYMSSFPKYLKIIKECGFDELSYYIKRREYKWKIVY